MGLNRSQLKELADAIRAQLSALQAEIHDDAARGRDESYAAIAGSVTDPADKSVTHLLADLGKAEVSRDLNEARALEAALLRTVDGKIITMAPMANATNPATPSNFGSPLYGWRCGGAGTTVPANMLPSSCRGL